MLKKITDKIIEEQRYNAIAKANLEKLNTADGTLIQFGKDSVKKTLRDPYVYYENCVNEKLDKFSNCLELGSGEGRFTRVLLNTGCKVTALDISKYSNKINKQINKDYSNLDVTEGDIEKMPFQENSFDFIVCAGSLSYGRKKYVQREILRILKPNGYFISVDSLNNSFIYRINRYFRYLLGDRSKMTLVNMWNTEDLREFSQYFDNPKLKFFGSISWLEPVLSKIIGEDFYIRFSRNIDSIEFFQSQAFKFVFVGQLKNLQDD